MGRNPNNAGRDPDHDTFLSYFRRVKKDYIKFRGNEEDPGSIFGFCAKYKLSRTTLYNYVKGKCSEKIKQLPEYTKFLNIIEEGDNAHKSIIYRDGVKMYRGILRGNGTVWQMFARNVMGWDREEIETDEKGKTIRLAYKIDD